AWPRLPRASRTASTWTGSRATPRWSAPTARTRSCTTASARARTSRSRRPRSVASATCARCRCPRSCCRAWRIASWTPRARWRRPRRRRTTCCASSPCATGSTRCSTTWDARPRSRICWRGWTPHWWCERPVNGERLGTVLSVRTGRVRTHARPEWDERRARPWHTGYWKDEREGPVRIGALGLEGDEQADRRFHGGAEMAVLMYAARHYASWRALPGLEAMGPGGFGENLVLDGADETQVCAGDVLEAGEVRLQISSPRGPCADISRRWNTPWLLPRVLETRRT